MGNPNARSPTQANLVQVCESTEITYDKNVVNFQVKISSVPAVYRRCAQGYHSSIGDDGTGLDHGADPSR